MLLSPLSRTVPVVFSARLGKTWGLRWATIGLLTSLATYVSTGMRIVCL